MQKVSSPIATRFELLELVETLGMYAHIEQPNCKQRQSIKSSEKIGRLTQFVPLQSKNSAGFRFVNR